MLSAALNEQGVSLPERPATVLSPPSSDGYKLNGTKIGVPYAESAQWLLVTTDSAVVVIAPTAAGVALTKTPTSNASDEYVVTFTDVQVPAVDVLEGATVARVNQLALATMGAFAAGLVAGALRLTADYVATREQFGRPLSTFQTVAAQLSEIYIASRTIDLLSTSAVWRLAEDLDAAEDLAILGYWLTSQASPAMRLSHHLHGGMGMDITYPMDRYYSSIKDLTRLLGGVRRIAWIWWEPEWASEATGSAAGRARRREIEYVHRSDPGAAQAAIRTARIFFDSRYARRSTGDGERPAQRGLPRGDQADGHGRQARRRLAQGVRRPGLRPDRAADLHQRGEPRRHPAADGDAADRRPDPAGAGHRGTEEEVPAGNPLR